MTYRNENPRPGRGFQIAYSYEQGNGKKTSFDKPGVVSPTAPKIKGGILAINIYKSYFSVLLLFL
jgi:hypothetical protein